jgi:hypothetical protein
VKGEDFYCTVYILAFGKPSPTLGLHAPAITINTVMPDFKGLS